MHLNEEAQSVCSPFRTRHCQFLMKSVWESRALNQLAVLTVKVYEHAGFFLMVNIPICKPSKETS